MNHPFNRSLTEEARQVLVMAQEAALQRHTPYVDVEHLLLALLDNRAQTEPLTSIFLTIDRPVYSVRLSMELGIIRDEPSPKQPMISQAAKIALEEAAKIARQMGHPFINGGHMLLGLFATNSELVNGLLAEMGLKSERVWEQVKGRSQTPQQRPTTPIVVLEDHRTRQAKARREFENQRSASLRRINPYTPYVLAGLGGLLVYVFMFQRESFLPFVIILGGWIFSLTLHEFSHAIVAYWGGDYTVKDKGYLTFNPLYYTHPLMSIILPMIILLLGGIGLPGGAVFIETHRLRSPYWRSAVALAGPFSNLVFAVVLSLPFLLGILEPPSFFFIEAEWQIEGALVFLIFLQIMAVFLNLLPIPPLDGFNAIAPFLPPEVQQLGYSMGFMGFILIFFVLFRVPAFQEGFFDVIYIWLDLLKVPTDLIGVGYDAFRFWR